ncbi:MAG: tyrosine-type recombinase/integrase [Planctomycetia bacterium]|nr:tyrosine-type recombinase/integrase [Planctomycetia bacterium]
MSKVERRKRTELPSLKLNAKSEYYINVGGKKIYMGRNLEIARQNLTDFVAGRRPGENANLLSELALRFLDANEHHPKYQKFQRAAMRLVETCGSRPVDEFGPVMFKKVRASFLADGLARSYVNELMDRIKQIIRFAVEEEMAKESTAAVIDAVKRLRKGQGRDNPPRMDVPDEAVLRTLPFANPTLRDMITIQRLSGMRPNEVMLMTMAQIDTSQGDVWIYRPTQSKTGSSVVLGKYEIAILQQRMIGKKPTDFLFSPQESLAERHHRPIKHWENRHYSRYGYNQAVGRCVEKANRDAAKRGLPPVEHWTPYQLRHASATFVSLLYGPEAARDQLGHTSTKTTARYDHSAEARQIALVRQRDADSSTMAVGIFQSFRNK